ncbi:MAG: hypothetical protein GF411_06065 [Candidatus Lokiarchaeota archaeon]|nr:hypothetical protein [Candidatus Lokiarchaeota archaeon]
MTIIKTVHDIDFEKLGVRTGIHPQDEDPVRGTTVLTTENDSRFVVAIWQNYSKTKNDADVTSHLFHIDYRTKHIIRVVSHKKPLGEVVEYELEDPERPERLRQLLSQIAKELWPEIVRFTGLIW